MNNPDFYLNSPTNKHESAYEDESLFVEKTDDIDDTKGHFERSVNTYQSENNPKFFNKHPGHFTSSTFIRHRERPGGGTGEHEDSILNSPTIVTENIPHNNEQQSRYDYLITSSNQLNLKINESSNIPVQNQEKNFSYYLKQHHETREAIPDPLAVWSSKHSGHPESVEDKEINQVNSASGRAPRREKSKSTYQTSWPRISMNQLDGPGSTQRGSFGQRLSINFANSLRKSSLNVVSWLKGVKRKSTPPENSHEEKSMPSFPKISMQDETVGRAFGIIRDKAFASDLDLKERRGSLFKKEPVPKLVTILKKHAPLGYSRSDDGIQFLKLVTGLKRMNMSYKEKFLLKLKEYRDRSKDSIKVFKTYFKHADRPLHPTKLIRLIWDIFVVFFTLYSLITVPYRFCFEGRNNNQYIPLTILDKVQIIFFLVDILLNFHTAYYEDGALIFDRTKVVKHYLRTWFIGDLLASLPYEWTNNWIQEKYGDTDETSTVATVLGLVNFLQVVRIAKITKLFKELDYIIYNKIILNGIVSLLKLCIIISFLAHWCACFWQYMIYNIDGDNWSKQDSDLNIEGQTGQYIAALYFSMTTMLTVGFGDIIPTTSVQRLYTIFLMVMGGGVLGYALNRISTILQTLEDEKVKVRKKILAISRYMQKRNLNKDVQQEVIKYLEFIFEDQNMMNQYENDMFNLLSLELKGKVYEQMNGKLIYENKVLMANFSKRLLYQVSAKIEERTFTPGERVYGPSETQHSLYFVVKGTLEMYLPRGDKSCLIINKGDHTGALSFFTDMARTFEVKSINFSHLLFLSRAKFLETLQDFPHDKEAFCMIRDQIMNYQDHSVLLSPCSVCQNSSHTLETCPRIQYIPDKEAIIKDYLVEEENERRNFIRRSKQSFHCLINIEDLAMKAQRIVAKYPFQVLAIRETPEIEEERYEDNETETDSRPPRRGSNFTTATKLNIKNLTRVSSPTQRDRTLRVVGAGNRVYNTTIAELEMYLESRKDIDDIGPTMIDESFEYFMEEKFDRVMNFPIYFPHNNISKILERMKSNVNQKVSVDEIEKLKRHLRRFFKAKEKYFKYKRMIRNISGSDGEISRFNSKRNTFQ